MNRDLRPEELKSKLTEAESFLLEAVEYLPTGDHLKTRIEAYLSDAATLGDDTDPAIDVLTVPGVIDCRTIENVRRAMRDAQAVPCLLIASDWIGVDLAV
ncbi:hypothetical protein LCM08_06360 [Salipiger pacificus]|nr:hypothetical protein [Alloyangia pacifica]